MATARPSRPPRPSRDGRVDVYCPKCSAQFRVQAEALDSKIRCSQCQHVFAAGRHTKKAKRSSAGEWKGLIGAGLGLVVVAVLYLAVQKMAGGGQPAAGPGPAVQPREEVIDLGSNHPRVVGIGEWLDAVTRGNRLQIEQRTDFEALQKHLGIQVATPILQQLPARQEELRKEMIDALLTREDTALFREFEYAGGQLPDRKYHDAATGKADIRLNPKDTAAWASGAEVEFGFRYQKPFVLVTDWRVIRKAEKVRRPAATARPAGGQGEAGAQPGTAQSASQPGASGEPARPKPGAAVTVGPLAHLASTPPALQTEIDALVAQIADVNATPRSRTTAGKRLREIGKPAIPRLLNKFFEIQGATDEERQALNLLNRQLTDLTGHGVAYMPSAEMAEAVGGRDASRETALQKWYAWWEVNKNRVIRPPVAGEEEDLPPMKPRPKTPATAPNPAGKG